MKEKIFSAKLYLQGLKKIRAVGIAASICVIVLNAIIPIINLIERSRIINITDSNMEREIQEVSHGQLIPFGLLFIIFAPLLVYSMFSFLNERSKSDFFHSLPQTRTCVFISFLGAIITWELAILTLSALINYALWSIVPYYHIGIATVVGAWAHYAVLALLMTGFMSIAMTLTGTVVSNFLIFAIVALFVRTVGTLFIYSVEDITSVFILSESWLKFISFDYFLPWNMLMNVLIMDDPLDNMALLAYSFCISLLLLGASAIFYKKRRSEIAGHSAPNKRLQTVFRSAVTIPFILIIVFSICSDGVESYQLILAAIALLVYCLFELMTQRNIKIMLKAMPKIVIPIMAGIVFMSGIFFTRNMINSVTPSENEISGISFLQSPNAGTSYEEIMSRKISVNNADASRIVSEALKENIHYGINAWHGERMYLLRFNIELTSGSSIARKIYVNNDNYTKILELFSTSEEYKKASIPLPEDSEIEHINVYSKHINGISSEDIKEIWNSFKNEYQSLSETQKIAFKALSEKSSHEDNIPLIHVSGHTGNDDFYSEYPILNQYTPQTTHLLVRKTLKTLNAQYPHSKINDYIDKLNELKLEDADYFEFRIEITPLTSDAYPKQIAISHSSPLETKQTEFEKSKMFLGILSGIEDIDKYDDSGRNYYSLYSNYNCSEKVSSGKYYDYKTESINLIISLTDEEYESIERAMNNISNH